MAGAPYDETFKLDDELCFYAEVLALAHIGERYDELTKASLRSIMSPDDPSANLTLRDLHAKVSEKLQEIQGVPQLQDMAKQFEEMLQEADSMLRPSDDIADLDLDELDEIDDDEPGLPRGTLIFGCGPQKKISRPQIDLFNEFVEHQEGLRPQIEAALRDMYQKMREARIDFPDEGVLFPEEPGDTPLQCFYISGVELDSFDDRIVMEFDSLFVHYDEHGCYIAIRDGKVTGHGTWDEVFGGDNFEDDNDGDFDENDEEQ